MTADETRSILEQLRGGQVTVEQALARLRPAASAEVGVAPVGLQRRGCAATLVADVGVAGIHRVLGKRDVIAAAEAIIVVAGMDGALPSVVGGLVDKPVIAVPTSVGYGAAFHGIAPLLTMLNACPAN